MLHLVFHLTADNRAAILVIEALQLLSYLMVEVLHNLQIFRVVRAHFQWLCKEPIWKTATANLTVTERTNANNDRHVMLLAQLQEAAQVALPVPAELSFHFFVQTPEHIRRQHGHAARLHLQNLFFPLFSRITRIVELAHHGDGWLAVNRHVVGVYTDATAYWRRSTHTEVSLFNHFRLYRSCQFINIHSRTLLACP